MMSIIFSILYLIMPWVHLRVNNFTDPIRLPKTAFFDFICLTMIGGALYYGLKFVYRNKYLFWAFCWITLTILFNWYWPFIQTPDGGRLFNIAGIEEYLHFILGIFAVYVICGSFMNNDYERIAKAICLSAVLVSIFAILQICGLDPVGKIAVYKPNETYHFSAYVDHPNTLGNFLALSFPFFLYFKKPKYILGALICIAGIILSKSTMSITVFILVSIFYLALRNRNKRVLLMCFILFISLIFAVLSNPKFNKISNGFTGRKQAWEMMYPYFKENPLFGQGFGVVKTWNIKICASESGKPVDCQYWNNAHSDWYERAMEIGLLGVFFMILVVLNSIQSFNYNKDNILGFSYLCSFITFLFLMIGSFPMGVAPNALLGLIAFCGTEKIT